MTMMRSLGVELTADPTLEARFFNKVQFAGFFECWIWKGATAPAKRSPSYRWGVMRAFGKAQKASRVSWMLNRWAIPAGMKVLHMCDDPLCVNPGHLMLGTQLDNVRDMDAKKRRVNMHHFGEQHANTKLSSADVAAIRSSTETTAQLAARYGVSWPQIRNIQLYRQRKNG